MGCSGGELQQAVVSWCSLLIARSCMHDIYCIWVLGLAEDLEARVLKSSPQTKAPGNTPRAKARPTQYSGGVAVGVERIVSDGKLEAFPLFRARRSSRARRATGIAKTAGAGRWVWSESVPTENPRCFHYLDQGILQEKLSSFNKM